MEIEIGISSDKPYIGKTTVAIIIARALAKTLPDKKITIVDPEGMAVQSLMTAEQEYKIHATSIKIIDNARLYGHTAEERKLAEKLLKVSTIPVKAMDFQDSASILIDAYARGEARGKMEWSDLDQAVALAKQERPGLYEKCLASHRARDISFVTHRIDDGVDEDKSDG
jgi:hypothetical protein